MSYIDDRIKEQKMDEFDTAMFIHVQKPCKPIGDCIYCLTYGQILHDMEAPEYVPSDFSGQVVTDLF
jgi:hypothetical protein